MIFEARLRRVLAHAGVQKRLFGGSAGRNNRRGQDKSGGPARAYAVVVVGFSALFTLDLGAASGLQPLRMLAFSGTNAVPPFL